MREGDEKRREEKRGEEKRREGKEIVTIRMG